MNLELAPTKGMMYALYKKEMKFIPFQKEQLPTVEELQDGLLELHLFDACKEYRYVVTKHKVIECVISDDTCHFDDLYKERIFVMNSTKKIEVVNYITYDEDDLMHIENYRLAEVR